MIIRKLLRKRKPIMRNFMLTHDPIFPKPGQKVIFACGFTDGSFEQSRGTYHPHPARIVEFPDIGYRGIPIPGKTIPFKYVHFWAPFRGEGIKHVKTKKV